MMGLRHPQPLIISQPPLLSSSSHYSLFPFIQKASVTLPVSYLPVAPCPIRSQLQTRSNQLLAQLPGQEDGPIPLPPSTTSSPVYADPNNPNPLQVATSVLLTGAISIFLFRSLRRRAKRAKETRFRSSGVTKKGLKEEALDGLRAMQAASVDSVSPPSPIQAFLGGLTAGAIAIVLYNFTTTVEGALNRQTISDNFSVRQITITIRTIINGLCYLATFVFGVNAIGLVLYSGQLAINSFMEPFSNDSSYEENAQQKTANPQTAASPEIAESNGNDEHGDDSQ